MRDFLQIMIPVSLAITLTVYLAIRSHALQRTFHDEMRKGLRRTAGRKHQPVTEADLAGLPEPVRRYLGRIGVVGRERADSLYTISRIDMDLGAGRGRANMLALEYNTFDADMTRVVLMTFKMGKLPVVGLDSYIGGRGRMQMRPLGLLSAVDACGHDMDDSSAAAMLLLNMCIAAPATLIDPRLAWRVTAPHQVQVTLRDRDLQVSAWLDFDDAGDLVRFTTNDKYYSPAGGTYERITWTTPVLHYRDFDGLRLPSCGEATWRFPAGDSCYGRLTLERLVLNPEAAPEMAPAAATA